MSILGSTRADSLLADIECEFRDLEAAEFTAYRYKASRLKAARDHFVAAHGRAGGALFREWRAEHLGLGASPASRMLTIAEYLPESVPDLPQVYLWQVARAVKLGLGTADELLAEAATMSHLDFTEAHALVKKRERQPAEFCCPYCGCRGTKEDFE